MARRSAERRAGRARGRWACALLTGALACGYRFTANEPALPDGVRSVRAPLLVNRTFEPQAEAIFTQSLREQLGRAGVLGGSASDGQIRGEILSLSFDPVQSGTLASYRLSATAALHLERQGKVLASTRVTGIEELLAGAGPLETDANRGAALRRLADSMMRDGYERLRTGF